jgi:nitrate reductase assembly molybdenum cofactor insertion protein NarJ
MYELYQEEQRDWPEDARVKEIVATLEESGRKAQELKSRLQERDDRYRANVQSFRQKASLPKTKSEEEVEAD